MLNNKSWNLSKFIALFVIILVVVNFSFAKTKPVNPPNLKLLVVSKITKKTVTNKSVKIYSDNGIRCIQAPCPTNGIDWKGKTDKHGYLIIPNNIRQASMTIQIPGFQAKELNQSARKIGKNSWIIYLLPE